LYGYANPALYTDPSGQCIFTGIDTVACIIALAVGIPVVAGISTAAWNYSVIQGGGWGGFNKNSRACINMGQVLEAGKGGFIGAVGSEGITLASIPLAPTYLMAYLVYGETSAEVNMNILSAFGLDDEYRDSLRDPYYFAGQAEGNAGMTYISLATFLKGLPTIGVKSSSVYSPIMQPGGIFANRLILTLPGIEVIGGSGELVYVGNAGMFPQFTMVSGEGRGPQNKAQGQRGEAGVREILEQSDLDILGEEVNINVDTPSGVRNRRVDFLVQDSKGNIIAIEVKTGCGTLKSRQTSLDNIMATQGGIIRSDNVPHRYLDQRLIIQTIYITLP
jgi:hypothetical protein